MGSSHLPVELTDHIIGFYHDDKKTLSNCALTHPSWLAASRSHLFHTITTTGAYKKTTRATRLKSIVDFNQRPPSLPLRHPSILPYIKAVKIESLVERDDRAARHKRAALLAHTIRQLCNREGLPAPSVHVALSMYLDRNSTLRSFSLASDIITHLKLSNTIFNSSEHIWPFISSSPRLQYLELEKVWFDFEECNFPAEGIFHGVPLSTIRITTGTMGFIIDSLIKVAGSLSHLDDFGITYQDVRQETLPQLADAIQRRVKCLRFSATCYPGNERLGEHRPSASDIRIPGFVGRFRSLNTLVLDNLLVDGSDGFHRSNVSFEWIEGVLQQLSSPIRKLVFEVTATECSQLDAIPWASINSIVHPDTRKFKALVRVEVLVKRGVIPSGSSLPIDGGVVCSEIAQRLPGLELLGLLRCDTVGF